MNIRVASVFVDDDPLANLNVGAGQAVIEALAMAVYADATSNTDEERELQAILTNLSWSWSNHLAADEYVLTATRLARSAGDDESRLYFFAEHIAQRLTPPAYEPLYRLLVRITSADGTINRAEKLVLGAFSYAFRLSEARALVLFDNVVEQAFVGQD